MKKLEEKLNEEYKNIGYISIQELHEEVIDISKIIYIESIMNEITPLDNDKPIIIAKNDYYDNYKIIDGYHRIKGKIVKGEKIINTIILDKYHIERKNDTLFEFLKQLVGKNIKFVNSNFLIVDRNYYQIIENEGCGGCDNGWSSIEVLPEFIDKNIKVRKIESISDKDNEDIYNLVINDKNIAKVDTGWGNGYYGGDFRIDIIV